MSLLYKYICTQPRDSLIYARFIVTSGHFIALWQVYNIAEANINKGLVDNPGDSYNLAWSYVNVSNIG